MERVHTEPGIVGGGVLSAGARASDLESRLTERAEQLYRTRLVRRFLLAWLYPGNAALLVLAAGVLLFRGASLGLLAALAVPLVVSIVVSSRLAYRQHFKVRAMETETRELERAHRENADEELGGAELIGAHKRYRAQLPKLIEQYRVRARRYGWKDRVLQAVVLTGSISTTAVIALSLSYGQMRWAALVLSVVVAVAAAFAAYANYQQRGVSLGWVADSLEREYHSVELRVGRYRRIDDEHAAYAEFADTVAALRAENGRDAPDAVTS